LAQGIIGCPLRGLELVGTFTAGYEPTIVGGPDALATDDADTSYVDIDPEPGASSGAYLQGIFDAAAIPEGHMPTAMMLAVRVRDSGSVGASQAYVGVWDSAQHPTREDAQSVFYLWGDYSIYTPAPGGGYQWVEPEFGVDDLGFGIF
jgi:hypothetical protein